MHDIWATVDHHILRHMEGYGVGFSAFILAVARCMIKPGTQWNRASLYKWFYDSIQSVIPGSSHAEQPIAVAPSTVPAVIVPEVPTLPETAQPKE